MTNTDWISLAHQNQDLSLPPFINIKHNKSTKFHHFQSVGNKLIENSLISMSLIVLTNMSYLIKANKVFIKIPSTYNTTPMRNIIFDSMTLTKDLSMWFPQSTSNTYINSIKPYLNFHLLSFSPTVLIDITALKLLSIRITLLYDAIYKTSLGATKKLDDLSWIK